MGDKKGYWYLRLKQDFFKSEEMLLMQAMKDGYLYSDILMKMYLASLDDGGRLMFRGMIPYSPEMLATVTGHNVGVVEKAVATFRELGLIEVLESGEIFMTDIQNFIGRSSTEADRKREYRQRIAEAKKEILIDAPEKKKALPEPRDEPKAEIEKPSPSRVGYTTDFEDLWKEYPRKKEKAEAYGKYKARLGDGFSHEELLKATRLYAAECRRNRTEERYIKQGKTFFGPNTPFLDYLKKDEARALRDGTEDGWNPFRR